jgi:tRNA1Val (adenine37-N6)-methyltransferase
MKLIYFDEDETLDVVEENRLKLIQPKRGYRFTEDSILLASFVEEKEGDEIVDIGSGSGIIAVQIALRRKAKRVVCIEIQEKLARCAERNIVINSVEDIVEVIRGDARKVEKYLPPESFDIAVSNPPYIRRGTGRISSVMERAIGRYEDFLSLPDLLHSARYLLRNNGLLYIVYPMRRFKELFALSSHFKLIPLFIKHIYRKPSEEHNIILFKAKKVS